MESPPSPPPRVRSRERQREDTRQRIYDAAMDIFRRDGFDVARVDDVAKAAGVSHGTFYFHFATKDEVLIQCLRASEVRVAAVINAVPAGAPLIAVLDAASVAISQEWEGDPRLFPDVAMVAARHLFRGHVTQMVSHEVVTGHNGASPPAAGNGARANGSAKPTPEAKSLTSAVLAARFAAAAERGS